MTTAQDDQRIYGVPGAENLHDSIADAYESQVEPYVDEDDRRPRVIEEFTVHAPEHHMPNADCIVEWLIEQTGENGEVDEGFYEHLENHANHPDVIAAADALRVALAGHITYRMADRRVAEHAITWDEAGEPLVNGEPMYVMAAGRDGGQADG